MPKITYAGTAFKPASRAVIQRVNQIIGAYAAQGLDLTLRQTFYQFVSRGWVPNTEREYKKLGDIIANARMAGLIDWDSIVDRTRYVRTLAHWDSPEDIVRACASQFRFDRWARQPVYLEVAVEKDALIGVLQGVCEAHDVPYLACRGYASASEIWRMGHVRMRPRIREGRQAVLLYLGDHDPSGIDMSRDLQERLRTFTGSSEVKVKRLALNWDQIQQYNPPPNPAKTTDGRYETYREEFGDESFELDALDPLVIRNLIEAAIVAHRNQTLWDQAVAEEEAARRHLAAVADNWQDVVQAFCAADAPRDEEE